MAHLAARPRPQCYPLRTPGGSLTVVEVLDPSPQGGGRRARLWQIDPDGQPEHGPWRREAEPYGPVGDLEEVLRALVADPTPRPRQRESQRLPISEYNAANPISTVLIRLGLPAAEGRYLKCPWHEDTRRSRRTLLVMRGDRRVLCMDRGCWANRNGGGRDSYDVADHEGLVPS